MNYGADAADQIVRYSMDGVEHTLRISGAVAKNLAIFIAAVMKDQKKTRGRTRMERPDCWPRRSMRWPDWDGSVTASSPSTIGWRTSCIRFRMRRKRYGIPGTA